MRFAFALASAGAGQGEPVTKSNAQQYGMALWDEVFARVAADHPESRPSGAGGRDGRTLRLAPRRSTSSSASNLYGDILSDLGSALAGSLGLAASANLDPERARSEPVRARARLRAGHRGPGRGQPGRGDR